MPQGDDLEAEAQHLQTQLHKLEQAASTLRTLHGRLGELTYRENSHIPLSPAEQQERMELPTRLREAKKAIRAEFPSVPATINGLERAIHTYRSALSDVKMLQEHRETSSPHTPPKPALRDLYNTEEQHPRQRNEPERSR